MSTDGTRQEEEDMAINIGVATLPRCMQGALPFEPVASTANRMRF
jgi:hypothetical protein